MNEKKYCIRNGEINDSFQYSLQTGERTTLYRKETTFRYKVKIISPDPAKEKDAKGIDKILKDYLGLQNDP